MRGDNAWWAERLVRRGAEAGPPLFRKRSSVYRRKSMTVRLPSNVVVPAAETHAVFLAATAAVLHRYRGGAEVEGIVVGSPPSGTGEVDTALPMLLEVDPATPFGQLVDGAAEVIAESESRTDFTIDELWAALGVEEVTDRHPLFSVVLRVEGRHSTISDLRNDVTVMVAADALELEYNANVHTEATIARFGGHVLAFAEQGRSALGTSVRAVDYLLDEDRTALSAWGQGEHRESDGVTLHRLFEFEARARPDREALVYGDQVISYGELNARANRLANHLRSLGAGPGTRVGLCVPATPELTISTLGVLKSGAAVVPIVPTFPDSRNRMTVEDSGMALVVTDSSLSDRFGAPGPEVVSIDRDAERIADADETDPDSGVTAADPLYVLFTSGSTGRPKGTVVEHRRLVDLVRWQRERGEDPAGRRTLQRTSIGFDVSFQEIFSTLGFGGSLVVASDEVRDDVSLLPEHVERYGIARLFLPPVALNQMAVTATLEQRAMSSLREIVVAGEQLHISMPIRRLFHQLDCSLDNQYGPTETHVVTAFELTGPSMRWPAAPPIGKPVRNVRVHVLDPWSRPVPPGVPGEIHVAGIGPAEGYLDEEAHAGRFIPDPFGTEGERLYRTGDCGRFTEDGEIEFLGRYDDQVKIRGYRIELGEVETVLARQPGVRMAAAVVHETEALGKQLAAFVVADHELDPVDLRRRMLEDLPGHMVPARSGFVFTDALPLTLTGKVNRRELPPLPRAAASATAVAEGDTEETVAKVWATALGLDSVGRDSDFIELGGHSLVGIHVVAQLNELFSISLPLRTLLRGTTVAALAVEIDAARGRDEADDRNPAEAPSGNATVQAVELPGGLKVYSPQPSETEYLYQDVFEHRTYDRGGVRYPETGVVIDVGAHIGLFTLYAKSKSPALRVLAFEPCPPLFDALRRTTGELDGVELHAFALGAKADSARFTYYPDLTGMSSFHPDDAQERALLSAILGNSAHLNGGGEGARLAGSHQYLDERLAAVTYTCARKTLSTALAESGIEHVDLLKIDVQKAELEVLEGVADEDWGKIDQVVVEAHDLAGRLDRIVTLLKSKGFHVEVEQNPLHAGTVVHFVYAVRP
ncbi:amino acid adenylation protein [Amycolatopsis alba DSM 44262]|uniref:Amino acid adenylation protein n=1 Tax=Amycolatopsis alba DSM 44262 TaxID=1125972 RepID=A0A229RMT8_AMYAL|nr:amino acid adenylation protein [Amycolatopsis alba DSM 44262]